MKYLNLILDSDTKEEIFSKIIEDKLRSYLYGNPIEVLEKDKIKLAFKTHFKANYQHILDEYKEITARRNIVVHNNGRIDENILEKSRIHNLS